MVQISVQDTTKESKVRIKLELSVSALNQTVSIRDVLPSLLQTCYGTNSPVWEDAFTFFIQDPRKQDIDIQVSHYQ